MATRNPFAHVLLVGCAWIAASATAQDAATPTYADLERLQAQAIMAKARAVLEKAGGETASTSRDATRATETLPNVTAVEGPADRLVARILYANGAVDNRVVTGAELQGGLHVAAVSTSGVSVRRGQNGQPFLLPWSGSAPVPPLSAPSAQPTYPGSMAGPGMAPGAIPAPMLGN